MMEPEVMQQLDVDRQEGIVPAAGATGGDSRGRDGLRILLAGLLSGALYLVVYLTQRAIYLNGLRLEYSGMVLRGEPADTSRLLVQLTGYYGATISLFVLYGWQLSLCRQGRVRGRQAQTLALLFPVLFNLAFLPARPYMSFDVFSYLAHGYLGATPGSNPYIQAAGEVGPTPFGRNLVAFGWRPVHGISPYGPLWTHLEIAAVRLAGDVAMAMLMLKSVVVLASLGSAVLIWSILGRVRPADQLLGTLVYLWNPAAIVEFASDGHNDAVMIFFILLALLFSVRLHTAPALVALMLGILTKYLPLIMVPAHLVYFWRAREHQPRLGARLLLGLLIGLGLAALLYWPLWAGSGTLRGVRERSGTDILPLIRGGSFGVYLLIASFTAHNVERLVQACAGIALLYVLVGAPDFFPWYAAMPLALMALSPRGIFGRMALVLPLCARLVAPLNPAFANGFIGQEVETLGRAMIGLALPLMIFVLLIMRQRRAA